jgi:PKD repeat protein
MIRRILLQLGLLFFTWGLLIAQFDTVCNCNQSPCGGIIASLNISDENAVVCEGFEFTVQNQSDISDVSYYIWAWGDGTRDTVFTTNDATHLYNITDSMRCNGPSTSFSICLVAVRECGEDMFSCHFNISPVTVKHLPRAEFDYSPQICISDNLSLINMSCNEDDNSYEWTIQDGRTFTGETVSVDFGNPGNYWASLRVSNECGADSITKPVSVYDFPDAVVEVSDHVSDTVACVGDTIRFIDRSNVWSSTRWLFPTNDIYTDTLDWKITYELRYRDSINIGMRDSIPFLDTIEIIVLESGNYPFELYSSNICGDTSWIFNLRVEEEPTVVIADPGEFCETAAFVPDITTGGGEITSYQWSFPGGVPESQEGFPVDSIIYTEPGQYNISVEVISKCGTDQDSTILTLFSRDPVSLSLPDFTICTSNDSIALEVDRTGGIWSGPGIIDVNNGIFNPALVGVGDYTVLYTIGPLSCQVVDSITISVFEGTPVQVEDLTLCEDSDAESLMSSESGGVWIGHEAIDEMGFFDPEISGVGVFDVQYQFTDDNGCVTYSNARVTVDSFPVLMLADSILLCLVDEDFDLSEMLSLEISTPDGTVTFFSDAAEVSNQINPIELGVGEFVYNVEYVRNRCTVNADFLVDIIDLPEVVLASDTSICISEGTLALNATPSMGRWSGPGIEDSGLIDLSIAGGGTHLYNYVIFEGESCEVSDNLTVEIIDPGATLTVGPDASLCFGESLFQFTDYLPLGGEWSGAGVDGDVVNLSELISDSVYVFRYSIEVDGFDECRAADSLELIIHSLPIADFDILGRLCINEDIQVQFDGLNIQQINFDMGDGTVFTQSSFSHTYSNLGDYNISLFIIASNGCSNSSDTTIYISTPPMASFLLSDDQACEPYVINTINMSQGDSLNFEWMVGEDTFLGEVLPAIQLGGFGVDTNIVISLNASNFCGMESISDSITIFPLPNADFGVNQLEGCSPLEVEFSNVSSGNPDQYVWDFGDGSTEFTDEIPPNRFYTTVPDSVSTYLVSLIVQNFCGEDTLIKEITVFPPDVRAFIEDPGRSFCQNELISIQSFSTAGSINTWKVFTPSSDSIGFSGRNAQFVANEHGTYTIVLFASRCGTDADTIEIEVLPAPEVSFDLPPYICQDEFLQLINLSNPIAGSEWDFGNGEFSTETNPTVSYSDPGVYTIGLRVFSLINDCPADLIREIEVKAKPQPDISANVLNGCQPLSINFEQDGPEEAFNYWNFGDGNTSNIRNPSYIFRTPGTFVVNHFLTDEFNCKSDTSSLNIIVYSKPESIIHVEDKNYCVGYDSIHFLNESVLAVNNLWFFSGNTDTVNIRNLSIWPQIGGEIIASLIVESINNCRDTSYSTVMVNNSPIVGFNPVPPAGCPPLNVSFDNSSEFADLYLWRFADLGGTSVRAPDFIFSEAGEYAVRLIAYSENECPGDTAFVMVRVHPSPIANFEFEKDIECGVPVELQFTNTSSGYNVSEWFINDNLESGLDNWSSTIFNTGEYLVYLRVSNEFSCVDEATQSIEVFPQPMADFSIPFQNCINDEIRPVILSEGYTELIWLVSDEVVLLEEDNILHFGNSGEYELTLIAKYNEICTDTFRFPHPIQVYENPIADFEYITGFDDNIIGEVQFENLSLDFDSSFWDLGDGTTSTDESPFHEYFINGDIEVLLIVSREYENGFVCLDSIIKSIAPEWIATFFAPNAISQDYGEGLTRVFKPVGVGIEAYEISVYSPWGERVWLSTLLEDHQPAEAWDGTYKGQGVPQGAYSWIADVTFQNGTRKLYKGSVNVIR